MRTGCGGEYLGLRGTKYQGSGENYIVRNNLMEYITLCLDSTTVQLFFSTGAITPIGGCNLQPSSGF